MNTAFWRSITIKVIIAVFALGVAYDFIAFKYGGQDATITQVVRDNSAEWLLIPVLIGVVGGHLFWSGYVKPTPTVITTTTTLTQEKKIE
jgi:hypothetical protein